MTEEPTDYIITQARYVVTTLLPGEDIWIALGRVYDYVTAYGKRMGQKAITTVAYHEEGKFIKAHYLLLLPVDDAEPKEEDTIH
jgi:hypothetical protein